MTNNIASTKRRILQYLDSNGVKISSFLKKTGIKRGFLDGDKLDGAVTDLFIAKIIASYPDINLEWLITGNGNMLKNNSIEKHTKTPINDITSISFQAREDLLIQQLQEKDLAISNLNREIGMIQYQLSIKSEGDFLLP